MTFWLIAGALTALAVGLLLLALLRRPGQSAPRAAYDLGVFRDQLNEIAREAEQGKLAAEQAAAARTEIERRLLATAERASLDPDDAASGSAPGRAVTWGVALALTIALPAAAIGLYLALGAPGVPSLPFAERPPPETPAEPAVAQEMGNLAGRLAERLSQDPDNRDGWLLLGRTYTQLGRFEKAAETYRLAIAHGFDEAETRSALGEVLVAHADGFVGPEARQAFAAALERDPADPRARYYAGLALAQDDRLQEAIDLWVGLVRQSPPDAPWRPMVARQVREAAARLGVEPPELPAAAEAASEAVGPSAADIEAARRMNPEEQSAFIRSMVEGLAQRLEERPEDFAGWLRLARAHVVLGEPAKAKAALARAAELVRGLPEDAPERTALDEALRALPASP